MLDRTCAPRPSPPLTSFQLNLSSFSGFLWVWRVPNGTQHSRFSLNSIKQKGTTTSFSLTSTFLPLLLIVHFVLAMVITYCCLIFSLMLNQSSKNSFSHKYLVYIFFPIHSKNQNISWHASSQFTGLHSLSISPTSFRIVYQQMQKKWIYR